MKQDIQRSILELQLRRSELMNEINEINLQITFLKENLMNRIEDTDTLIEVIKLLRHKQSDDDKS